MCPLCKGEIKKEQNINKYIPNKAIINSVNSIFNNPENEEVFINGEKVNRFNVILLGNSAVGKTSIFCRLKNNSFKEEIAATIGPDDITTYFIKYKNQKYNLIIHDTAGQEKYKALTKNIMRGKDGVLFIYDISNQESFDCIESWYDSYKEENKEVVGLLIGNKCDKERKVDQQAGKQLSEKHGLNYFETSAKLNHRIRRIILSLLNKIIKSKERKKLDEEEGFGKSYFSINTADALSSVMSKRSKKKCC